MEAEGRRLGSTAVPNEELPEKGGHWVIQTSRHFPFIFFLLLPNSIPLVSYSQIGHIFFSHVPGHCGVQQGPNRAQILRKITRANISHVNYNNNDYIIYARPLQKYARNETLAIE